MRRLLILLLLPLLAACASVERLALPAPEPLTNSALTRTAEPPGERVDHSDWTAFLNRYVAPDAQGVNRVAYGQVSADDRARLDGYLDDLQAVDPAALTRDQQLAYWINMYNAVTVDVILENYPVASIRDIKDGPLSIGPWNRPIVTVAGQSLTLNEIEHRIIRPEFNEPRIHYALNCAAVGCPNLMDRAWQADTLERDFAAAEHAYINDPRGVRFNDNGGLILSKIFIWFREDFGPNEQAVLTYVRTVADPDLEARLQDVSRVSAYKYDWALNDAAAGS
ncbi:MULTISPECIES: DUF547 domain-containing protein [unclassified Ruegeria]|uniref:DUF547 domain-containing protein n=1 Tax=unclassified Ruegeria TaxID=2625375 RepID=UPI001ADC71C5|nr:MULTISPECIES: DUF547 domain-containing protein [unclassified Ruegeria]MBO9411970.1 DUF547 domain-containing protein [Ruegeria sp. R8_1]MBO9417079.1 DUF547 domain-containing protein [Ruegeria sp. R8_2]